MRCLKGQWPSTRDLIVIIVCTRVSINQLFNFFEKLDFWRRLLTYLLTFVLTSPLCTESNLLTIRPIFLLHNHNWPIRGQYSGHVTSIDQSEASIQVTLTNQRPINQRIECSNPPVCELSEIHGIEHRQIMGLKLFRRDFPVSSFYIMELYPVYTGGTGCDAADFVMIRK